MRGNLVGPALQSDYKKTTVFWCSTQYESYYQLTLNNTSRWLYEAEFSSIKYRT